MSQPVLTCEDVRQCALQSWISKFSSITFKTVSILLPHEFIDYLIDDSIPLLLPEDANGSFEYENSILEGREFPINEEDEENPPCPPCFPGLMNSIQEAIKSLGNNGVFVKLNWSAPQDAVWITMDKTLKCFSATDVVLLLKSSDAIAYDLNCPYASCVDKENGSDQAYYLHLRQWQDLHMSMEFRCFIRDHQMVAISQRHVHIYYAFLVDMKDFISDLVLRFFRRHIENLFPLDNCESSLEGF
jgi:hypothetical protein